MPGLALEQSDPVAGIGRRPDPSRCRDAAKNKRRACATGIYQEKAGGTRPDWPELLRMVADLQSLFRPQHQQTAGSAHTRSGWAKKASSSADTAASSCFSGPTQHSRQDRRLMAAPMPGCAWTTVCPNLLLNWPGKVSPT